MYELQRAILRAKTATNLPRQVPIAEHAPEPEPYRGNIAIEKLQAQVDALTARLNAYNVENETLLRRNMEMETELAIYRKKGYPALHLILRHVSEHYKISEHELKSRRKPANTVLPRQIFCYLASNLTPCSLPEIGRFLGDRDHTVIMHARNRIAEEIKTNADLAAVIEHLKELLKDTNVRAS